MQRRSIAFDLDMTLVDTRAGIHAALCAFADETGYPIDADEIVATLGPPVADALAPYVPAAHLTAAVLRFREHMADVGVMNVTPLLGAADAINAVRARGYTVGVVTSKIQALAVATLHHAGLEADHIYGDVFGTGKAQPLRDSAAIAYVGDHPADMIAAARAHTMAIAVTSGSAGAEALQAAGADVVLTSLDDFPEWLGRL
jgi:phosphoglycolate phosphatase